MTTTKVSFPVQDFVTPEYAQQLTDAIKDGARILWDLISEAYTTRVWAVLGYGSWDAYCTAEFGASRLRLPREERHEVVSSLRDQGLSLRAIESATGLGKSTIQRDLAPVPDGTPDMDVVLTQEDCEALEAERSSTVIGTDGKHYQAVDRSQPRRRPLPEAFRRTTWDMTKMAERITRLCTDDRFTRNAESLSPYRNELVRARDALQAAIDLLPEHSYDPPAATGTSGRTRDLE